MIPDKFDNALATLVADAVSGFNVYTGKDSSEKAIPCIICSSEIDGDEDPPGTGNYMLQATIAIKQSAVTNEDGEGTPNPQPTAMASTSGLIESIMTEDLESRITAAATDLTVLPGSIVFGAFESGRDESGLWVDIMQFRCCCCGRTLT